MINISSLRKYLRLNPFDTPSEQGRSDERHRQIVLTTLSSATAKVVSVAVTVALIPLSLNYLGTERFGLWMTISAAVAMLGIADLGVGSGLINAVATAHGKDNAQEIRKKTAVGLLLLGAIALLILILFFSVFPFVPWAQLANARSAHAAQESAPTIATIVIFFALSIPAGIVFKVQMGLQMGFVVNLWLTVASLAGLGAVLGVIYAGGSLPYLAAATVAPPVIIGLLASVHFWGLRKPLLRPRFSGLSLTDIKSLAGTSGLFLVLQLSGLVAFQSDSLIIAHYLNPESVALYAVTFKLFSLPSIIMSIFLNALWPAYAEAESRGDKKWIYHSFIKSLKYSSVIVLPLSLVLLFGGKWIIAQWVDSAVKPTWDLLIALFFWSILTILGGNFAVLLNGMAVIKFQVITSVSMAIINIVSSIWLVKLIGISGVVWGSVLSLVFVVYLPTALFIKSNFK